MGSTPPSSLIERKEKERKNRTAPPGIRSIGSQYITPDFIPNLKRGCRKEKCYTLTFRHPPLCDKRIHTLNLVLQKKEESKRNSTKEKTSESVDPSEI